MKEYRIANGWAIFIYICTPLLIALFGYLLFVPFAPGTNANHNIAWIVVPISSGMIATMIIGLVDAIRGKFVIAGDRVISVHVFSTKEILLDQIAGYRINDQYIIIEPTGTGQKKIKISKYYGKLHEVRAWLADNYADLDIQEGELEKENILADEQFGASPDQREEKLVKAVKTARLLNGTGAVVGLWTIFYPNPYRYLVVACVIVPVICLIVIKHFDGLIRLDEKKGTAYPSIAYALFPTTIGLALRALLDYTIFSYSNVWLPSVTITLVYGIIALYGNREFNVAATKKIFGITFLAVLMYAYSYGALVTLNCTFDNSTPETFRTQVAGKRIDKGKTTTYYLRLNPWGPAKEVNEVAVAKSLFNRLSENDSVHVYLMKGLFKIPWVEVSE